MNLKKLLFHTEGSKILNHSTILHHAGIKIMESFGCHLFFLDPPHEK